MPECGCEHMGILNTPIRCIHGNHAPKHAPVERRPCFSFLVYFSFPCRHAPLLLGASRKGFLGKLIGGKPALERDAASVAAVVASIAGGADIVRVHNVGMCADGAHVADALYRRMM